MTKRAALKHLSISVGNPQECAEILAKITGGKVEEFSPLQKSFVCLWGGWDGQFIEFYPEGTILKETSQGCEFGRVDRKSGLHGVHLELQTPVELCEIQRIAEKYKCPHHPRPRDGGPLYEVWIDNGKLLIELVSDEIGKVVVSN